MTDKIFNVLFLCSGNSARSIMAECILNRLGGHRFLAFSAGAHPKGDLHTETQEMLARLHYDTASLRSKSWDEFAADGAPELDFVFTLSDDVAALPHPAFKGQPMIAHWGIPDPASIEEQGAARGLKLAEIYRMLNNRIDIFVNLRMESLDRLALKKQIDAIGSSQH